MVRLQIFRKRRENTALLSPHKSYLVNIGNIKGYDKKTREIIFYEDHRCPITRMKGKLKSILEESKG